MEAQSATVPDRVEARAAEPSAGPRLEFTIRLVITACVVAVAAVLWSLTSVLLLVFASVLVALLLRGISEPLGRFIHLPPLWALAITVVVLVAVLAMISALFGATVMQQFSGLAETMPASLQSLEYQLGLDPGLIESLGKWLSNVAGLGALTQLAAGATNALGSVVVAFVAGVYLAAQPSLYREGLLALFPGRVGLRVRSFADATGMALRHWIVGQLAIMVVVGGLTGLGAFLIGLPSWAALGMIAGLLEFVPYVGPIATALPAVLLALPAGQETVVWTLLMLVAVQQLEGLVITPLVQRRAVSLPPALTLFALIGMGVIFGVAGVLLAVPLTILLYVGVEDVYLPMIRSRDGISSAGGRYSNERAGTQRPPER